MQKAFTITPTQIACSSCNLSEFCLPSDFTADELRQLETLASTKRAYRRGDYLYRSGAKFGSLYAIRTGFFKTQVLHEDGREQVTGFQMAGEIIDNAMQCFGAMGMTKEMPLQLLAGRVRNMRIYDGPSEVHRMVVARNLMDTRG